MATYSVLALMTIHLDDEPSANYTFTESITTAITTTPLAGPQEDQQTDISVGQETTLNIKIDSSADIGERTELTLTGEATLANNSISVASENELTLTGIVTLALDLNLEAETEIHIDQEAGRTFALSETTAIVIGNSAELMANTETDINIIDTVTAELIVALNTGLTLTDSLDAISLRQVSVTTAITIDNTAVTFDATAGGVFDPRNIS